MFKVLRAYLCLIWYSLPFQWALGALSILSRFIWCLSRPWGYSATAQQSSRQPLLSCNRWKAAKSSRFCFWVCFSLPCVLTTFHFPRSPRAFICTGHTGICCTTVHNWGVGTRACSSHTSTAFVWNRHRQSSEAHCDTRTLSIYNAASQYLEMLSYSISDAVPENTALWSPKSHSAVSYTPE